MGARDFADWLDRQLRRRGMSQAEFARRLETSSGTVNRWLHGAEPRKPSPASCDLIADVLGVDRDEVLAIAGHRPPDEELAPDDPRRELIALVKRVRWTPERAGTIRALLEVWRGDDAAGRTPR